MPSGAAFNAAWSKHTANDYRRTLSTYPTFPSKYASGTFGEILVLSVNAPVKNTRWHMQC